MKIRVVVSVLFLLLASMSAMSAQRAAPATDVTSQLRAIVEKTNAKIQQGKVTEAALKDELREFDALLAANAGNKTDAVAQVLVMKAALYLQIFEDPERAAEMFQQVKADFPGTRPAHEADRMLVAMEGQKAQLAIQAALKPGAQFPDFKVTDLSGAPLSVERFKGKVVLVDFWATWCGPCIAELPAVQAAYSRYKDKGFEIIGISLDRDLPTLKRFIAERKLTWPQYFDGKQWQSPLAEKYGVNSIPATYLLDGDGRIVAKNLRGPALEAELARLLRN